MQMLNINLPSALVVPIKRVTNAPNRPTLAV